MSDAKGKAVLLLQRCHQNTERAEVRIRSFAGGYSDDAYSEIQEWLEGSETWPEELARLKPGEWVRYDIRFYQRFYKQYDHYYGGYEWASDLDAKIVRTLKRGRLPEPYFTKRERAAMSEGGEQA